MPGVLGVIAGTAAEGEGEEVISCSQHEDVPATYQLTLYDRHVPPKHPTPKWRGFACDGCIEAARAQLKLGGGQMLLVVWSLRSTKLTSGASS